MRCSRFMAPRFEMSFLSIAPRVGTSNTPALSEHEYTAVIRWENVACQIRQKEKCGPGTAPHLGRQMIHGARSVAFRVAGRDDGRSKWLQALVLRRGCNRAVVALANKTARIAWALLTRQEIFRAA